MASNKGFMQFFADVTGARIVLPATVDVTSFGVAMLARLGCGLANSIGELAALVGEPAALIHPRASFPRAAAVARFSEAVALSRRWRSAPSSTAGGTAGET